MDKTTDTPYAVADANEGYPKPIASPWASFEAAWEEFSNHCDFSALFSSFESLPYQTPWQYFEKLRQLLVLQHACQQAQERPHYLARLRRAHYELSSESHLLDFQLTQALLALNAHFLDIAWQAPTPKLWGGGALPMAIAGHWPWAGVPHLPFQAETALLWNLLGRILGSQPLVGAAYRVARWQLNALDHEGHPFLGLLTQERDASLFRLATYNALLFATFHDDALAGALHPQLQLVAGKIAEEGASIGAYAALLYTLGLVKQSSSVKEDPELSLPSEFDDPYSDLVGWRRPGFSVVATLVGGHTGLGALHQRGLDIVTFGPQFLPLGECEGFGIDRGASSKEGSAAAVVAERLPAGFILKGTVPVAAASLPESRIATPFSRGNFSGVWMDVQQKATSEEFRIDCSFLGLRAIEELAFCFYVKAKSCLVGGSVPVAPLSLDRFSGRADSVQFRSGEESVELRCGLGAEFVDVIPLAGRDHFWGADFLVAFTLHSSQREYAWIVKKLD